MEIDSYYIICPYCQNKCGEPENLYDVEDDDKIEFECDECDKKFWVERCVTVDYRTEGDCELNNKKHRKGEYHCKKCDVYNPLIEIDKLAGDELLK